MGLNHVYKVIWNKTKGCYVVVSELAKRVGRNKAKAIVMATAAMAMVVTPAVMNVNQVEATVLIGSTNGTTISDNGSTVSEWGITIGGGITNAGSHTVHVGDATLEEGNRNVIIGTHATAGVDKIAGRHFVNQSVAIGSGANPNEGARAFGDQSIAIGANTIAEGNSSIAIGNDDVDKAVGKRLTYTNSDGKEETSTLGTVYTNLTGKDLLNDGGQYADTRSGEAAVAIGVKAEAGDISLALGTGAKAKKVNTVSIGTGATADLENSVAIGGGALADESSKGTKQTSTTINGITYEWAGGDKTNKGDIVSFGKPGFERQLKNIAAGEISSTSTDAINGSQIHSLVEKITGTPKLSYTTKDGTPVYKLGDKFYKVNEKGQPISAAGKPAVGTNEDGKLVDADKNVIEPIDPAVTPLKNALVNPNPAAGKTGTTSPTALNNITSNLVNFDAPNVNGKVPAKNALRNLVNDAVSDDTVATVGDLRNMGWIVSADKTTGTDGTATDTAYSETVKNANEVKFVGKDGAIVSGATDAATGVRTITVGLDKKAMSGSGDSGSPVAYTKADGTKVYPVKAENGSVTYHTTPNGDGPNDAEVPKTEVITSVNGPEGTTTPAALTNVAGNLVGAKKDTNAPTIEQVAPTVGKGANEVNPNNAATVGDVLNAGWNLQENGTAKDFVKPYDKVNFVNGGNTTAVVTTNAEGTVSNVSFNVTGLPVSYTTEDGKPVSKVGDKFYKVNEQGQPISEAGKPAVKTNDAGKLVDEDGTEIEPINPATTPLKNALVNPNPAADKTGTTSPTALNNVTSGLNKYGDQVDGKPVEGTTPANTGLIDLSTPADGAAPKVSDNTAATVGDLRNMGWIVSADKTTGDLDTAYSATVKNANEVKFVGTGTAIVSGETKDGVRTITVNVDDQVSTNNATTPVVYTKADGTKVYPIKGENGVITYHTTPDGKGDNDQEVPGTEVITSVNSPDGTTTPATLANVAGNLDGAKKDTTAPKAEAAAPNTTNKDGDKYINPNNAATVGDVLNAGWNLQENGTAKDFVKPYDKVNFVNGGNTTAVVTTNAEGTVSNVSFNVTGLPVSYTTEDGKPVSKVGDKFYKVNEQGQPISEAGKPAVKTNDAGKLVDEDGTEIEPINPATTPLKNALVNPNPAADKTGTTSPTALNNVTSGLNKYGDQVDGKPVEGTTTANTGLIDLSTPADGAAPKVSDNTAATVGDLRNMGWIVSADKTTGDLDTAYSATVKNANEVKFVGTGTAIVSGETKDGVRTITVNVDDQVSTNNATTPVVYTKADGTKVYPIKGENGVITYHTTPDGKGDNDQEVPGTEVITSVNSPDGTTTPATLANVAGNLDGAKKDTTAPKAEAAAPNTTNKDGDKYINPNNAATVGDVLNAGWNLQENGTAKDFVKPYDKVNFVNGGNTTAVVTTNAEGTVSNVSFNVTGLPVSYTTEDGKPVSKVGDKFYKVNEQGQPVSEAGKPAVKTNDAGKLVDEDGTEIEPINPATTPLKNALVNPNPAADKTETTSPTALNNVTSGLNKYGDQVDGKPVEGTTPANTGLIDLSTPADGAAPKVSDNTAATVGDLRNMGWIVSADKTTGDLDTAYSATVKNANEVKFVGTGTAIVSGETKDGVRTITVNVDDQVSTNNATTPVVYTKADGTKVYPIKGENGVITYHTTPDGKGDNDQEVPGTEVITSVNSPDGTTTPATLANVAGNLDGAKKDTTAPKAEAAAPNTTNKDGDKYINPNNAATVGDVLNAGWNLQENGTAKDFVKPYDTVNFINGANTTAVVTTSEDGTTSKVTYNVTGLPVTYTTEDGKPVSKVGDKFYKVNEQGQPLAEDGTPAAGTDKDGNPITADGTVIKAIDPATEPLKTALVNPNPAADKTGTTSPTALNNVTSGLNKYGDQVDGKPVEGTTTANTGLIDLSTPADGAAPKVSDNTAATVGDLRNMGWIVSADKTTGDLDTAYSATVKNANEVKFVGTGTAIVSGETKDGVRTITVNVDDQVSTNNAVTPVVYTDKEGNTVYPIKDDKGNVTYHTTPDGKGENDKVVPNGDVNTSVNGPKDEKGNTRPASLGNVKNNIPAVNDADKKVTNPDGTEAPNAGDVTNINKAPLTAEKAADLLKPMKDGKANPNFVGNNAATVSDVLNAGWNLQNNGEARDFVKPFDTVNFVNGGNTTAVVTTKADGTTSDVTFNVTGLPIATTITDPTTGKQVPVVKVGDTFYPANPDGTPNIARNDKGEPTNGYVRVNDGKLYPREAVTVTPAADPTKPPTVTPNTDAKPTTVNTNLANPNVDNTTNEPGNNVNTPTQLGNVANGANTFAPVAADGTAATDAKPAVKLANDGKWYPADQVEANGKPKADATPVANPLATKNAAGDVLERGNDGNWYKASDLENGEPKPNVDEQTPVVKPENAEKTGLVNFENSNPNNAATVGDLQNLGFVVAAHDNGYVEQMRNANKVEFKGSNGVSVTGKTLEDGTREITVALKEGRVTNDVIITNADGTETHGVRGEDGKIYAKDPKTGKATKTEITVAPTDTVTNDGNAYVTGNSVATAIQKSGWNIGIGSTTKEFSTEEKTYEKVNPSDKVKYVNGDNTTVSMAVDEAKDKDGTKVTTTYVKVDVNRDLKIDSVTAGGPAKDGVPGKDGAMAVKDAKGNDGVSATAKDGKGTLTLNNAGTDTDGKDASTVNISTGKAPTDLANTPKDGAEVPTMDRIQYTDGKGTSYNVATMDDGLRFQGDDGESISKPLNSTVQLTGGNREDTGKPVAKDATTTGNIGIFNTDGKLSVQLAKDLDKLNSANFESKTDKAGNPLKVVDGQYYPEKAVVKEGKVYPEGTVIIDNKPYPAGSVKDPNTNTVVKDGKPATEATPITPIDSTQVQDGPTSKLTGTGLTFNTPTPKDEKGNPLVLVDGKYYKADNLENGKPKADAKPEPVKPAQSTAFTPDGLVVTPDTAKVVDPKTGEVKVDPNKVVSFGAPSIVTDPATGKPVIDPKTGEPVMKSGISAGGQVMANVAPGVLDTDAVNVSQLKGVSNMVMNVNNRVNRLGAQAAAMAGLRHLQYDPLEPTTIMAGVGTYKGEGALALGIAHYKNESTLFHAGASIGSRGDELMANAGVSWKFGSRADETAVKDTFRQGPISASYTLQDKVSALEEQNQVLKEQVAELFRRLNEKA